MNNDESILVPKLKSPQQSAIEQILSDSDIVWPRYGSDTIEALAQRIVDKLNKSKNNEQVVDIWSGKISGDNFIIELSDLAQLSEKETIEREA